MMEFMELIHVKINWALVGSNNIDVFSKINKFEWSAISINNCFLFYLVMHMTYFMLIIVH